MPTQPCVGLFLSGKRIARGGRAPLRTSLSTPIDSTLSSRAAAPTFEPRRTRPYVAYGRLIVRRRHLVHDWGLRREFYAPPPAN